MSTSILSATEGETNRRRSTPSPVRTTMTGYGSAPQLMQAGQASDTLPHNFMLSADHTFLHMTSLSKEEPFSYRALAASCKPPPPLSEPTPPGVCPYSPVWVKPNSRKCVLGVLAMDKKTKAKPMRQILDRLRAYGEIVVFVFGNQIMFNEPIEKWPLCDALIAFDSGGFPFQKVCEYIALRKPFCVNDLPVQAVFRDRRQLYRLLEQHGIPTPRHMYADRSNGQEVTLEEYDDYIVLNGERMDKPLVEKPFDAEDHNVYIYFGKALGGGSRRLFRKIANLSSQFFPVDALRREGSYCYEPFLKGGKDLKVYTLGPGFAHGETRKSPAIDGLVERDPDNKELRLLTRLTSEEKAIAADICTSFKQTICGFDIIRWKGKSYVIDVNGWSFVKGEPRYYDKSAHTLRQLLLGCPHGCRAMRLPPQISLSPQWQGVFHDRENENILLSLVAVFRHADRTPKQKVKIKVSQPRFLSLFSPGAKHKEIKLKDKASLSAMLMSVSIVLADLRASSDSSDGKNGESSAIRPDPDVRPNLLRQFEQVHTVLSMQYGGTKVQLKPLTYSGEGDHAHVATALLVCKWGGEMTHAGIGQARQYAPIFWDEMLRPRPPPRSSSSPSGPEDPDLGHPENNDVTQYYKRVYREQRKAFCTGIHVYATDEARVQASARAFLMATLSMGEMVQVSEDISPFPEKLIQADDPTQILDLLKEGSAQHAKHWSITESLQGHCEEIAEGKHVQGDPFEAHIQTSPEVQKFLDDTSQCSKELAKAKRNVELLVTSKSALSQTEAQERILFNQQAILLNPEDGYAHDHGQEDDHGDDYHSLKPWGLVLDPKDTSKDLSRKPTANGDAPQPPLSPTHALLVAEHGINPTPPVPRPLSAPAAAGYSTHELESSIVSPFKGPQEIAESTEFPPLAPAAQAITPMGMRTLNIADVDQNPKSPTNQQQQSQTAADVLSISSALHTYNINVEQQQQQPQPQHQQQQHYHTFQDHHLAHSHQKQLYHTYSISTSSTHTSSTTTTTSSSSASTSTTTATHHASTLSVYVDHSTPPKSPMKRLQVDANGMIVQKSPLRFTTHEQKESARRELEAQESLKKDPTQMTAWAVRCLRWLRVPREYLLNLYAHLKQMVAAIDTLPPDTMFCHETLSLFKERWATLVKSFYDEKTQKLDATKIPDLDDCIKYDALHNVKIIQLLHPDIRHVYRSIRQAADFVIPQEYGVLRKHKLSLGKKMVRPLLQRITENLEIGLLENASSRVHLYFSSESHIHALRNVIQLSGLPSNKTIAATLEATELNYMSHGVFRLFLDPSKAEGDPYRYYVSVMFSPGAALNPFTFVENNHMLPVSRPVPVNGRIPLVVFKQLLEVN